MENGAMSNDTDGGAMSGSMETENGSSEGGSIEGSMEHDNSTSGSMENEG